MIPAVIWIGAVGSLLAVWVEAVVAAPLWAFTHLDTDGEGMGQRSTTGYLFIVNVLFRPSLMVVGFLLGSMMVDIMTDYVMALYPIIIANASMNSWTGMIKIAGYVAAFVIILQMIVNMSFQLIRFVPYQVLGWLGGNATNSIGAQASDEVGGAAKNAMAGRGMISGAFSKQVNSVREKQAGEDKAAGQKGAKEASDAKATWQSEMLQAAQGGKATETDVGGKPTDGLMGAKSGGTAPS